MLDWLYNQNGGSTGVAGVLISLSLMLILGFLMTRLTKLLRLPNVTAYIVTGILMGPYVLDVIPAPFIHGTEFLTDVALSFIAFSVGEHFEFSKLRKQGGKSAVITLFEALTASFFVFILTHLVLKLDFVFSIVLAALASATAPASTMMTIRQTEAKGDYVDTLLQVVAMDDVAGLVAYSIAIAAASSALTEASGGGTFQVVILPFLINLLLIILGAGFAWLLKLMTPTRRTADNRLIIAVAILLLFSGVSAIFDVSPLLGCMTMGMVFANIEGHEKLFKQLNYFNPPILLLFFVRSGLTFDLSALVSTKAVGSTSLAVVGVLYFFVRLIGKYVGAFLGSAVTGKPKEVRNYLGLALAPQAGVAIGLAALCARQLGPEVGGTLQTIILASSVLYELIGPASAKLGLYLSNSYLTGPEELPGS
ncbi:MAG TPA: cation:proton antiporter [Bacillota bacterium]|jgi:Kef-type K+ transport system membrane component KefB|nr:cation:proton antiporter [Fastidiosipila sp.]HPX92676.1 cation:proton antiporter [Bacillota bacterium]HQB81043.1 cation:proton antiporter [Bacillota bacterium]